MKRSKSREVISSLFLLLASSAIVVVSGYQGETEIIAVGVMILFYTFIRFTRSLGSK